MDSPLDTRASEEDASVGEPSSLPSPMRKLGRGGAAHALIAAASRLISFVAVSIFLRALTAQEFGTYSLALLNEQVAFTLVGYSLANALGMFYSQARRGERATDVVVGTAVLGMLGFALVGGLLFQLVAAPVADLTLGDADRAETVTRLVGLSLMGSLVLNVPMTVWLLDVRIRPFAIATVAQFAVAATVGAVLVLAFDAGAVGAVGGWTAGTTVVGTGAFVWALRHHRLRFDRRVLGEMLRYGLPLVPGALVMLVLQINDRYLVRVFSGLGEVGVYAAPVTVATALYSVIIAAFKRIWTALMWDMRGRPDEADFHRRTLVYYLAAQVVIVAGVAAFGDVAMYLLAGDQGRYTEAAGVIALVYSGFVAYGVWDVLSAGYFFEGRTIYYSVSVVAATLVAVGWNLATIPAWGIWAAAVSNPLSFSVMAGVSWWYGRRYFPVDHQWGRLLRLLLLGGVLGALALAARATLGAAGVALAVVCLAALAVIIYAWVLDDDDRAAVRRVRGRVPPGVRS